MTKSVDEQKKLIAGAVFDLERKLKAIEYISGEKKIRRIKLQ
jgi:hypothetical protein